MPAVPGWPTDFLSPPPAMMDRRTSGATSLGSGSKPKVPINWQATRNAEPSGYFYDRVTTLGRLADGFVLEFERLVCTHIFVRATS